jgi:hypothetical protein
VQSKPLPVPSYQVLTVQTVTLAAGQVIPPTVAGTVRPVVALLKISAQPTSVPPVELQML